MYIFKVHISSFLSRYIKNFEWSGSLFRLPDQNSACNSYFSHAFYMQVSSALQSIVLFVSTSFLFTIISNPGICIKKCLSVDSLCLFCSYSAVLWAWAKEDLQIKTASYFPQFYTASNTILPFRVLTFIEAIY